MNLPGRAVLAWTTIYTAFLPQELRDRRREEVAADLLDELADPEVEPLAVSWRLLRGVCSDITWRIGVEARQPFQPIERPAALFIAAVPTILFLGLVAITWHRTGSPLEPLSTVAYFTMYGLIVLVSGVGSFALLRRIRRK